MVGTIQSKQKQLDIRWKKAKRLNICFWCIRIGCVCWNLIHHSFLPSAVNMLLFAFPILMVAVYRLQMIFSLQQQFPGLSALDANDFNGKHSAEMANKQKIRRMWFRTVVINSVIQFLQLLMLRLV